MWLAGETIAPGAHVWLLSCDLDTFSVYTHVLTRKTVQVIQKTDAIALYARLSVRQHCCAVIEFLHVRFSYEVSCIIVKLRETPAKKNYILKCLFSV